MEEFSQYVYETNLSAKETSAGTSPWFSFADELALRAEGTQGSAAQRSAQPRGRAASRQEGQLESLEIAVGIPRANRLRRAKEFERVRVSGRAWVNRWLVLGVLANDVGRVRVGVSASRRVGGAVKRARAKRLIREAVRPRLKSINAGSDLVFIARSPLQDSSFQDVDLAVAQLLGRARVTNSDR